MHKNYAQCTKLCYGSFLRSKCHHKGAKSKRTNQSTQQATEKKEVGEGTTLATFFPANNPTLSSPQPRARPWLKGQGRGR
ncbi:hypothetical protein M9H77_32196 [Catharanthus roseus]|uniref:Uncharacterized protein n=1 Tax=Catharanthus roseus TaxID=4058 RepID=A0ACC0A337_CATRO|nr:hypothetical protein M9H77_32196 [Catharanthus roseus]